MCTCIYFVYRIPLSLKGPGSIGALEGVSDERQRSVEWRSRQRRGRLVGLLVGGRAAAVVCVLWFLVRIVCRLLAYFQETPHKIIFFWKRDIIYRLKHDSR